MKVSRVSENWSDAFKCDFSNIEAKSDLYRDVSIWNFNVGFKKVILENFVGAIFDYEMFRAKCKGLMQTVIYIEIEVLIWNFVNLNFKV